MKRGDKCRVSDDGKTWEEAEFKFEVNGVIWVRCDQDSRVLRTFKYVEATGTHPSHVLYTGADFTDEEISRGNDLANAVVEGGLSVCKVCGEFESGLSKPCVP